MLRHGALLIGSFLTVLTIGSSCVLGQLGDRELSEKRITIQMVRKPLYTVFTRLIEKYDLAIGFEESVLDREHRHYYFETNVATEPLKAEYRSDKEILPPVPPFDDHLITIDQKEASIKTVMDEIVKQLENYDWKLSDGVVNIFPVRGRDSRLKKLLDLRVRSFGVGRGADVGSIQAQIISVPEFKTFLAENNLEMETGRPGTVFTDRLLADDISFTNLTFGQLLNRITRSKRGGWILQIKTQKDKPGRYFVELHI